MADTTVATGLTVQQWDAMFFKEYLEENRFKREMGTSPNNIIQLKTDLTKKKGDSVTYALVNKLTGAGVTGSNTLEGNEEAMDSRDHKVTVDKIRNAVRVAEVDEQFSSLSLRDAGREVLKDWIMEKCRDDIISALGSVTTATTPVAYGSASEAQKDAFLVDNTDRILFGDGSVGSGTDHSADLALVTASMTLGAAEVSRMRRMALAASPKIRPIRTTEDERWFVLYTDTRCFRDLKADTTISQANREAWQRGRDNPIFSGGDLLYDGVIIKEIPDIATLGTVGASSAPVSPAYMCGAQAVGLAWAKRSTSKTEEFDYGDKVGVAIEEIRGIEKLGFMTDSSTVKKQHGVVTGYFGAAAD